MNKFQDNKGRFLPNNIANPTGKGGFKDNPGNINFGGRKKMSKGLVIGCNFLKI